MSELDALARIARMTLAEASLPILRIEGIPLPRSGDPSVVLGDRIGQPTFLCGPGSPVTMAARENRGALLTVPSPDDAHTVTFAGRLAVVGIEHAASVRVDVIGLELRAVLVESTEGTPACEVPLELYAAAGADPLEIYAQQVLEHTNCAHHDDLRRVAAVHIGVPRGEIAGAALADLTGRGGELRWIDRRGAHSSRFSFSEPARTPQELADRLSGYLQGLLKTTHTQESR